MKSRTTALVAGTLIALALAGCGQPQPSQQAVQDLKADEARHNAELQKQSNQRGGGK